MRALVTLRQAAAGDAEACGQILFDAFGGLHDQHGFPRDFPALEGAVGLMERWIGRVAAARGAAPSARSTSGRWKRATRAAPGSLR